MLKIYTNKPEKAGELLTPQFAKNLYLYKVEAGQIKPEDQVSSEELNNYFEKAPEQNPKSEL